MIMALNAGSRRTKRIKKNEMDGISQNGNKMNGPIGPVPMASCYRGAIGLEL
jgi:hypothetical protein